MSGYNGAIACAPPSEAPETDDQKSLESTAPGQNGDPLGLPSISRGTCGQNQDLEHDLELSFSPDIVPGVLSDGSYDRVALTDPEIRDEGRLSRHLTRELIGWFSSKGVRGQDLLCPWPVMTDRVVFSDAERFEFARYVGDQGAENVFIIGVISFGGLTDLAAWQPKSGRLGTWLGRGFALGEGEIWRPNLNHDPLPIWRSPIAWLRAGRTGLVILNPNAASWFLCDVPVLVAEDANHRKEIEKLFVLRRPRIVVAPTVSNSIA